MRQGTLLDSLDDMSSWYVRYYIKTFILKNKMAYILCMYNVMIVIEAVIICIEISVIWHILWDNR